MRTVYGLVGAGILAVTAGSVQAQGGALRAATAARSASTATPMPADARQGFWVGAGLGTGAGSMHCGICEHEREQGTSAYLRAGTTVNRKLLLGVQGSGWQRTGDAGKRRLVSLTGGAWWYPNERHGYYLHWGAGISRWRASQEQDAVTSQAVALTLGVGYEVRVNPRLSIVPYLNALGSSSGSLWLENKDDVSFERRKLPTGGHALLFQIGLGITRH
jgi:hypothetical protein